MSLNCRHGLLAFVCALLLGCASTPGSDRCAGQTQPPMPGMSTVDNPALLNSALGQPGKGGLCTGQVRRQDAADQTVTVYRVYDSGKANSRLGRWWSFSAPQGPVAAYRAANAICPSWSQLNRVVRCQLEVGAQVAVGPGQSADCAPDPNYPPSPVNQVYVPNASPDSLLVERCEDLGDFPPAS
ncbi:hypothetical protein B0T40_11000 [Chromobacterium haemolyticum]|uniref:hypothetical protein n=1 Tax=Chromobacterium haemolyticum TaxID=394935 RepID=UPI0009DA01D5|nr:hypothetical protein [Chromobacterium haemolyticum]OQS36346.1 hypothetical protein B0T40_11000 [Chromobacterium haemolyticum]